MKCLFLLILSSLVCSASEEVKKFWDQYNAKKVPLNVEIIKEWHEAEINYKLVRYDLGELKGSNKSSSPKIAAYYAYPKEGVDLPGIVQIHGGGQRASLSRAKAWAQMGYACISINWGAKVLEKDDTANTDWDGLAAGFIRPGIVRNDELDHHNLIRPDKNTLYKEPHLLNSSWNLIAMSARRALTFLEQRPEVDPIKLGVEGHSMGGRSTVLTAIDPRIKAASPSVGGSGFLYQDMWGLKGSARRMAKEEGIELYRKTVSAQSYWPHIKAPILFLGATNDFNSPTECVVEGMNLLPSATPSALALAPHLNHRFSTGTSNARFMWMEAHLKKSFNFPKAPLAKCDLTSKDGIPRFDLTLDANCPFSVAKVEIFYGFARDPRIRFWRTAKHLKKGLMYSAHLHLFDTNEPLFAFANVTYTTPTKLPARPGVPASDLLTISSNYFSIYPQALQENKIRATAKHDRFIDDFSMGMQDWYQLNAGNPHHWFYATRKLLDPSFMGPKGARLKIDLDCSEAGGQLGIGINVNTWQNYTGRKSDVFYCTFKIPKQGLNTLSLTPADFINAKGEKLVDWDEITELFITPANRLKTSHKIKENWLGRPPTLKLLSWEGGDFIKRPYPHESRGKYASFDKISIDDQFQKAIDDSVELENKDENLNK